MAVLKSRHRPYTGNSSYRARAREGRGGGGHWACTCRADGGGYRQVSRVAKPGILATVRVRARGGGGRLACTCRAGGGGYRQDSPSQWQDLLLAIGSLLLETLDALVRPFLLGFKRQDSLLGRGWAPGHL